MIGGSKVKAFNIFDYQDKYAMHCDTEEKAEIFCKYLDSLGMKWRSGTPYKYTHWEHLKEETVYMFNEGSYCRASFYKGIVLEFDDFYFEKYEWE